MPTDHPEAEGAPIAPTALPALLRDRRERLGYVGDEGIDRVAGAASLSPDRWRQLERDGAVPAPEELPRIALALVNISTSDPADDPAELLARLRACVPDGP